MASDDEIQRSVDFLFRGENPLGHRVQFGPTGGSAVPAGAPTGLPAPSGVSGMSGFAGGGGGRARGPTGGGGPDVIGGVRKLAGEAERFFGRSDSTRGSTGGVSLSDQLRSLGATTPSEIQQLASLFERGGVPTGSFGGPSFPLPSSAQNPLDLLAQIPGIEHFSPDALRSTLAAIQGEQGLAEFALPAAAGAEGAGAIPGASSTVEALTAGAPGAAIPFGSVAAILGALAAFTGNKELGTIAQVFGPTLGAAGLATSGAPAAASALGITAPAFSAAASGLGAAAGVAAPLITAALDEAFVRPAVRKQHFAEIAKDIAGQLPTQIATARSLLENGFTRPDMSTLLIDVPAEHRDVVSRYLGSMSRLSQAEYALANVLQSGRREHGVTVPDFSEARPLLEAAGQQALQHFLADQQAVQAAGITEEQLRQWGAPQVAFTPRGLDRPTRTDVFSAVEGGGGGDVTSPQGTLFASDPIARAYAARFQYREPLPTLGPAVNPDYAFASAFYPFMTEAERRALPAFPEILEGARQPLGDPSLFPYVPLAGPPGTAEGSSPFGPVSTGAEIGTLQTAMDALTGGGEGATGMLTEELRRRLGVA